MNLLSKKQFATSLLVLLSLYLPAQTVYPTLGADCNGATAICDKSNMLVQTTSNGSGATLANSPSCFTSGRGQSVFLKFTVNQAGTLGFTITPTNSATEFDWALYLLTDCNAISSNPKGNVACNYYNNHQIGSTSISTGMNATGNNLSPFSPEINVQVGETYLLLIDKYKASQALGFSLQWGGTFEIVPLVDFVISNPKSKAGDSVFCCAPATVNIKNTTNTAGTFTWDYGNGQTETIQNPSAQTYTTEGKYTVSCSLQTNDGCTYTKSKNLYISPKPIYHLYIPTAFSPNGDGSFDTWLPEVAGVNKYEVNVYDRWGKVQFTSKNASEAWNGGSENNTSSLLPSGSYTYIITTTDTENKAYTEKGIVNIIK